MIAIACDHGGYKLKLAIEKYFEENKMQEQTENNKSRRLLRVILCTLLISAVSLSALPLFSSLFIDSY